MARQTSVHSGYTIVNGSGTGSNGGRIDVWVEYTLGTQSVTGNYTPVTAYFYAALNEKYTSSTSNARGLNSRFSVNGIAGTAVSGGAYDFTSPQKVNLLGSFSGNIPHNSDGTKTITIEGSFTTLSSYISGGNVSATVELPTIARASEITADDAAIEDTARVTVSRYAAGFTHSIGWKFGSLSGYLAQDGSLVDEEAVFSQIQLEFALPEAFYGQIPNDPSGICTLTCRTYQGSDYIGQNTCDFTVRADRQLCSPTVSGTVEDCNPATLALTGNRYTLVSGRSNALCTVTAQAKNGASITQLTDPHIIENIATDSRGYSGQYSVTLPLIPYVLLSCDASVKRTDPTSGNAVLTLSGKCYCGSFGGAENTLTVTCRTGEQTWTVTPTVGIDNSYYTTVSLSGLDYTQPHTLTVTAADCLDTVTKTLTVQKGQPVFDWGEQDFQFHVPVTGDFSGTFRGDFSGTMEGAYIRTSYVNNSNQLTLQSRFSQFESGVTGRQTIFLFGSANGSSVYGMATVWGNGSSARWSGTDGTSVSLKSSGQIAVNLPSRSWDTFTLISAEPFDIV